MANKIIGILIFFYAATLLNAQGFDWQYSSRLPFESPKTFFGFTSGVDYNIHQSEFNFIENYIPCCIFQDGKGIGYFAGLQSEYWFAPISAAYISILYSYTPAKFIIESDPLPILNSDDLRTEYELDEQLMNTSLELGVKLRLFNSHFHISAGLRLNILIRNTGDYYERVLSHKDWYWDERKIVGAELPDVSSINVAPTLRFGYDASIGLGKYMVPEIIIGLPISNITTTQEWKRYFISASITVYPFGLK